MNIFTQVKQWLSLNHIKIAILSLTAILAVFVVAAATQPTADQITIQNVCLQAQIADRTLPVPQTSTAMTSMKTTAQSMKTTDSTAISDADEQQMDAHVAATYQKYYTGSLLQQKNQTMQDSIHHYKTSDVRYLGGGVDSMTFTGVSVNGNTAVAKATVTVWDTVAQVQDDGTVVPATPHGTLFYTYNLTKQNGQWYITGESWQFAPGSQP